MVIEAHGIQLAEGEDTVREWHCAKLKRPKMDGYAIVTTRRLLYAGSSSGVLGGTVFMNEAYLNDIGGVSAIYGGGINLMQIIAGVSLFVVSLLIFFQATFIWPIGLIFLLAGLYFIYITYVHRGKIVGLDVYSKGSGSIPISFSAQTKSAPSLFSLGAPRSYIEPGPDAERMVKEISACIMDLQSDPKKGPARWSVQSGATTSIETQLNTLKSLYTSGAISKEEYDQQRQVLLRKL